PPDPAAGFQAPAAAAAAAAATAEAAASCQDGDRANLATPWLPLLVIVAVPPLALSSQWLLTPRLLLAPTDDRVATVTLRLRGLVNSSSLSKTALREKGPPP
ncbi:hypothetical protein Vretimale_12296, partial [Volvox reticuliferus]